MNANSSTTNHWLKQATDQLKAAGVSSARLDTLVLLEDATGKDRSWLLAHPEQNIVSCLRKGRTLAQLQKQVQRRTQHEPLAYIRGKSEFYGRDFQVTPDTLEPRPETETIIDLLKQIVSKEKRATSKELTIADIGTGSGCLAITAKLECSAARVYATDISEECLEVASKNAKHLGASVEFLRGNLLEPVTAHCSLLTALLCNLPYVPDGHTINQAAMFEPKMAIFGGPDGLDLYRELFTQLKQLASVPAYILTESLPFQHTELAQIAESAGYKLKTSQDFIQLFSRD